MAQCQYTAGVIARLLGVYEELCSWGVYEELCRSVKERFLFRCGVERPVVARAGAGKYSTHIIVKLIQGSVVWVWGFSPSFLIIGHLQKTPVVLLSNWGNWELGFQFRNL